MPDESVPCPGCAAPMSLDQEICGACRRPRDELEIEHGLDFIRARAQARKRRPYVFAYWALAATVIVLALLHRDAFLSIVNDALALSDKKLTAAGQGIRKIQDSAAPAEPPAVSTAEAPSGDLPIPPLDPLNQWALRGRVYDLITLRLVANAHLSFYGYDPDNASTYPVKLNVLVDQYGRFAVVLPRLARGSISIRSSHPDYSQAVLYESDIPYAKLSLKDRTEIAASSQDGDASPAALTDVSGEDSMHRDLFLTPRH